jgi:hypothetical protein
MLSLSRQVVQAVAQQSEGWVLAQCTAQGAHIHTTRASPTGVIIRHGGAQSQHHSGQLGQHLCLAIDKGSP